MNHSPDGIEVQDLADPGDYEVLKTLSKGKRIVFEFGTFVGGSALAILPQVAEFGGRLYCVDHFLGNEDDPATDCPRGGVVSLMLSRTEEYWKSLTVIIGETSEVLNFPSDFADMVFIDAGHSYHDVCFDIRCAYHLLKDGGILCGHDYIKHLNECDPYLVEKYAKTPSGGCDDGIGYGVIKAVHDMVGEPNHQPGTAVWWIEVRK